MVRTGHKKWRINFFNFIWKPSADYKSDSYQVKSNQNKTSLPFSYKIELNFYVNTQVYPSSDVRTRLHTHKSSIYTFYTMVYAVEMDLNRFHSCFDMLKEHFKATFLLLFTISKNSNSKIQTPQDMNQLIYNLLCIKYEQSLIQCHLKTFYPS